ncbi:MAG: hypothetical protein JXB48_06105 [Candidatus Latescibacteria bacterium]|nr:hypothetical protein [Candidatus Latescibacterota bacterium]
MEAVTSTYIWLVLYGISAACFFLIAVWVIVRGGKDVLEILSGAEQEIKRNKK